jgi:hypothetical protein
MGYWTFMDYPESERNFINHWSLFMYMKNGGAVRAPYYSYGLMTKFFRGPARVFETTSSDHRIRAGTVQHRETGRWSVAAINRFESEVEAAVKLPTEAGDTALRKCVYDSLAAPQTDDGDLQEPAAMVSLKAGRFSGRIAPLSLAVCTGYCDDEVPAPGGQQEMSAQKLTWTPSPSPDVIYYRIYFNGQRVASTTSPEFTGGDVRRPLGGKYAVAAVDSSGNPSPRQECDVAPQR